MIYDGDRFWTHHDDGNLKPFKGVSVAMVDDWEPVALGSPEHELYDKKFGPTPSSIAGNWMEWQDAIAASPVSKAMRRDAEGKLWVRASKEWTWIHNLFMDTMARQPPTHFRHSNHWSPMPADHPLAGMKIGNDHVPYREAAFAPEGMPEDQIDEWVRTGTCEWKQGRSARLKQEVVDHNAEMQARREASKAFEDLDRERVITLPKARESDSHVIIDRPEPEVLKNLIPLVESLTKTAELMAEIGDKETASTLGKQVGHLIGNASWHLRNNRTEFARRAKDERKAE